MNTIELKPFVRGCNTPHETIGHWTKVQYLFQFDSLNIVPWSDSPTVLLLGNRMDTSIDGGVNQTEIILPAILFLGTIALWEQLFPLKAGSVTSREESWQDATHTAW